MSERIRGSVINVHALGATVRLEDGRLAAAPIEDVNRHRPAYVRALAQRAVLPFDLTGRAVSLAPPLLDERPILPTAPAPTLSDPSFEAQIISYLKQTEEWAPTDRPQPFERHLFRKRARAKQFRGDAAP
jgi:hypothetical protein